MQPPTLRAAISALLLQGGKFQLPSQHRCQPASLQGCGQHMLECSIQAHKCHVPQAHRQQVPAQKGSAGLAATTVLSVGTMQPALVYSQAVQSHKLAVVLYKLNMFVACNNV